MSFLYLVKLSYSFLSLDSFLSLYPVCFQCHKIILRIPLMCFFFLRASLPLFSYNHFHCVCWEVGLTLSSTCCISLSLSNGGSVNIPIVSYVFYISTWCDSNLSFKYSSIITIVFSAAPNSLFWLFIFINVTCVYHLETKGQKRLFALPSVCELNSKCVVTDHWQIFKEVLVSSHWSWCVSLIYVEVSGLKR